VGTLFIENIHFLDYETQEYLAEFIKYGFYRTFRSNQKIAANVRIICSSHQDLYALVQENKFSAALFNELKRTTIVMPSLVTLPEEELKNLVDGYSEQALHTDSLRHLHTLSEHDKNKFNMVRPTSLYDLKHKVHTMLTHKSKKTDHHDERSSNTIYQTSDPDLIQAARLGKQALKDKNTMILLWKKLKNQNKIAHFLGVNRSSVNRRCKEYNLE
jgi:DNA-binding NtrC family response regulator